MRVYLSGAISLGGRASAEEIADRLAVFRSWAGLIRDLGYDVVDPSELPAEESWEAYMRHGLRAVADADLVAVLPRWEESRGARLEVFLARELLIPVVPVAEVAGRAFAEGVSA